MKKNIIMADCEIESIEPIAEGIKKFINEEFSIESQICNGKHGKFANIYRYIVYIFFPFKFFLKRKQYNYVIGWQQFFALFYIFNCKLFNTKKQNIIVILNFTYKEKNGFAGKLYKKLMKYCLDNRYLDYIHVPSRNYAQKCSKNFEIPIEKFIITTFGVQDTYDKWKDSKVEYNDYSLAIGRSNRDYDFLIEAWKKMPKDKKLLIICDEYKSKEELPENIIIRNDITGDLQFPYIMNCKLMIIPIDDESICSGDTVLLKAMSYYKPTVVTKPSTLAEMYIQDDVNGICLEKDIENFPNEVSKLLDDNIRMKQIGNNARNFYVEKFSRRSMGEVMGLNLKNKKMKDEKQSKDKYKKLSLKDILFIIIIFGMVFYSFGTKYITPYFNYLDDTFTLVFIGFSGIKLLIKKTKVYLNKNDRMIFISGCAIILFGLIGNCISQYQTSLFAIFADILSSCKFFGIYLASIIIFKDSNIDRTFEITEKIAKVILVIVTIIAVSNNIFDLGLASRYGRFGLTSYSLGGHPSFAAAVTTCCVSILLLKNHENKWWIILGLILSALTLRIKAIVYVLLITIYLLFYNKKRKIALKDILIFVVIAMLISYKYINAYFLDTTASRGAAMVASFKLALQFIPIGSGFATFGTVQSISSYSSAYTFVGLDNRYGFRPTQGSFVGDGGWATEIGQFGFLGTTLIISILFFLYRSIKERKGANGNYTPIISILLYMLICSTSELSFSSNYAVLFALALAILIKKGCDESEIRTKEE